MGLQNKRIYEISSKSNNGKVVKYTGKIFWGGISQGGLKIFLSRSIRQAAHHKGHPQRRVGGRARPPGQLVCPVTGH